MESQKEFSTAIISYADIKLDEKQIYAEVVVQFIYIYTNRQNQYKMMLIAGFNQHISSTPFTKTPGVWFMVSVI